MAKKKDARFTKVLEEGCLLGGSEIWVDTQTGVQYLLHYNGNAAGLTVLVDAEGKPLPHTALKEPRRSTTNALDCCTTWMLLTTRIRIRTTSTPIAI